MNNAGVIVIAVFALVLSLVGFAQDHSGRYQISVDRETVWRLDTVTGHISAYIVYHTQEKVSPRFIVKIADMPEKPPN